MERLTEYTKLGSLIQKGNTSTRQMIDKLGAYEDVGTIEEFKALKKEVELYRNLDKTNFSDGYNKAIDEFAEKLNTDVESFVAEVDGVRADLIDRQAVIDLLKKNTTRDIEEVVVTEKNIKLIMDMPKDYDVEKVVADLQALKTKYEKLQRVCEDKFEANELHIRCLQIDKDIEIVRKGGVE